MLSDQLQLDGVADWPNRDASRFVEAGALRFHVQVMGSGPALLLLHGTGAATHSWRGLAPLLAEHFTVIAPDLPGHGFTRGRPAGGLTMPAMAGAVGALMRSLAVAPALIVGHSAGAAIASRMAIDGLAAPAGVIGLNPAMMPFPGIAARLFPGLARLLFVNPFAPHFFAGLARQPGEVKRFLGRSTGSRIDQAGLDHYARLFGTAAHVAGAITMMADWDLDALARDLPRLAVPLLLLHGAGDAMVPVSAARDAAALVPGARVDVLPGLGHLAHEEDPALVARHILAFAEQTGARAP
ncbi:alpha/beta fold hydrolase BchO [Sphingomonas sp.]|uniref:alpha/beta fold hydrolase BchO n=1 Tax=Sphingomonas sp. TaxID=28214 RepID=UPI001D35A9D7|nr:alpha/beta fold hydrolase BchO [Sphingomonas sp.]MBX9797670.1 alpha/beta fold hydrolase [Sphingomonas sp.]